jgi:signal transduction histidine kinase/ActR/RegA family two-component response regulator
VAVQSDLELAAPRNLTGFADGATFQSAFLATAAAGKRQRLIAIAVVAFSALLFLLAIPFAKVKLVPIAAFIPAYESALIINDLITAILLLGQFMKLRSRAVLALAAGYLFDALIIVPHALSFPGGFAPEGVIGGGSQTTAWLYILWHGGFPLFVIAYAWLKNEADAAHHAMTAPALVLVAALFVAALVVACTVATTIGHDWLPPILVNNSYTPTAIFFLGASWVLSLLALAVLWWRGVRSVLDLWIAVVMCAWIFDIALSAVFNGGRYDLGFYAGRAYGLLAASFVLAVVLLETSGLFSRLAETTAELRGETLKLKGDVRQGIARQQEIEAQLRQAQKMEAIGNLTGGMAHDFNNLLGVIIGNLDLLRSRPRGGAGMDPEIGQYTGEALDAALKGAELTRRLLAFARRQPLAPKRVDINEHVAEISKLVSRTLGDDIEIKLDLRADVWPVVADPAQLEASLVNIINNARDAMPRGGRLTIATSNQNLDEDYVSLHPGLAPGNYVLIELNDTGTGIPPDVLSRIFEPFFTTKEQGKGTGLGLSMVFGFMKQSGGHVNVYSEAGHGTTFRLYLPRATSSTEAPVVTSTTVPVGDETILAVEDNEGLRRIAVRQLGDLGYRVIEAHDGASALRTLESEHVDLLFTDVVMPGGWNGYTLAKHALVRWPSLRILLTSGFPDTKLNGDNGTPIKMRLLTKPYRKDDLARAVRESLDAS